MIAPRAGGLMRRGILAALLLSAVGLANPPLAAAAGVPGDPNASGFIGLCDRDNRNVAGGSVHDTPFVWKAVSSALAPAYFRGKGQNAILDIYQPRPNVLAANWSGDQLTGASFYHQVSAPAAQATNKDLPLSVMIKEYPPLVDGLYQLRMYVGKAGQAIYTTTYPATWIRVQGDHWSVVKGGTVDCAAVTAQSLEVATGVLSVKEAYGSPLPAAHGKPSARPTTAAAVPSKGSTASEAQSSSSVPVSANRPAATSAAAAHTSAPSSSRTGLWIVAVLAAVAAAGGCLAVVRRRRAQ
jgi:hypothetical protein